MANNTLYPKDQSGDQPLFLLGMDLRRRPLRREMRLTMMATDPINLTLDV
jgi:hypothetical protein